MIVNLVANAITPAVADHGEGPQWNHATSQLEWVDMFAGDLLSTDPRTGSTTRRHIADYLAAFRYRSNEGMVCATEQGFLVLDAEGVVERDIRVFEDSTVRMNDGGCDRHGAFYAGTMAYDAAPGRGSMYRLSADLTVSKVLAGVTVSNGVTFASDKDTALYIDSAAQAITEYDTAGSPWRPVRDLVKVPPQQGAPDGLCQDAEGAVWVALWGGSAVHRYTYQGIHTHTVRLPVSQPTSCALGGPNMHVLYISTSRFGLDVATEPLAGALFAVTVDIAGVRPLTFAG